MNLIEQHSPPHRSRHLEGEFMTDFGDLTAELSAAQAGQAVVSPLLHYGVLGVFGEDATSFLQNQLTNDVAKLPVGAARHGAWCTAKGRMLVSFIVLKQETGFLLLLAKDLVEPIQKRLRMYVLRSKVLISALSETTALGFSAADLAQTLSPLGIAVPDLAEKMLGAADVDGTSWIRLDEQRVIVLADNAALATLWERLSNAAMPVGLSVWRWLDIQHGLPVITGATTELFVPQMVDYDALGGVSFNKGCYPGQEIVARTHYLGKVKRHLYRTHSTVELQAGQEIHSADVPDQNAAQVVSSAPSPDGGWDSLLVALETAANTLCVGAETLACTPVYPKD